MFALAGTALAATELSGFVHSGNSIVRQSSERYRRLSGDILTVASKDGNERRIIHDVRSLKQQLGQLHSSTQPDATTVTKNNTASSVASIAVGDTVMVQGTVSGTNVTATTIRDGIGAPGTKSGAGKRYCSEHHRYHRQRRASRRRKRHCDKRFDTYRHQQKQCHLHD